MERRRVRTTAEDAATAEMNRLYVAETAVTCTGAKADHRLALRPREIEDVARAVAAKLGMDVGGNAAGPEEKWVAAVPMISKHIAAAASSWPETGSRRRSICWPMP